MKLVGSDLVVLATGTQNKNYYIVRMTSAGAISSMYRFSSNSVSQIGNLLVSPGSFWTDGTNILMPFKTTDGSHIGVAKYSSAYSLMTYNYVQCSASAASKCFAELTNFGPSDSSMLAANILDFIDTKTHASLHLFDSAGVF